METGMNTLLYEYSVAMWKIFWQKTDKSIPELQRTS